MTMPYHLIADGILVFHLSFILFVLFGGLLVIKWHRLAWLHLPAISWGIWVEWTHSICPLTPLENHLRVLAGGQGYPDSFIEHYLSQLIYPAGLTPEAQIYMGAAVLVINIVIYGIILWRWRGQGDGER